MTTVLISGNAATNAGTVSGSRRMGVRNAGFTSTAALILRRGRNSATANAARRHDVHTKADASFASEVIEAFLRMGVCPSGYDRDDLRAFAERLASLPVSPPVSEAECFLVGKIPDRNPEVLARGTRQHCESKISLWQSRYYEQVQVLVPVSEGRTEPMRHLASAMRKVLPPALLAEVIAHLDPLTPFVEVLRSKDSPVVIAETLASVSEGTTPEPKP